VGPSIASRAWTEILGVERAATLVEHEVQAGRLGHLREGLFGLVPLLVGATALPRTGRKLKVEVVESEVAQQVEHERQQAREFVGIWSRVQKMCASSWSFRAPGQALHTPDFS